MRSWKSIVTLFVLLAVAICGNAGVASCEETAKGTETESKHTLWRISSEENSIYVAGSIHLLREEDYPLADALEKAFEESDVLVLEMDLARAYDTKGAMMMVRQSRLEEGETLEKMLSQETYAMASGIISEMGFEMGMYERYKPWFFAMTLVLTKLETLGFHAGTGVEFYLHKKAVEAGKEIVGLETMEFQLGLFESFSRLDQEMLLRQTVKDLDIIEKYLDRLVKAWKTGDVETLEELTLESFKEYPTIYEQLVTSRTKNWVPVIESLLKRGRKCMVVVGTGHVIGNEGLVELMKKKGYKVEQL